MKHTLTALALLAASSAAWAGRPLATDDAATADPRNCQLESWWEHAGSERALVLAPACGIVKGLEIDADYTLPHPRDVVRAEAGLALKWVPEAWRVETGAGEVNFGLKAGVSYAQPAGAGWRHAETSVLGLASLKVNDAWTVHANLGVAREEFSDESATLLKLAVVWVPNDRALLFAESQVNNKRAVFGGTVNGVGGRWWLVPEKLGLDLTASRESGSGTRTVWSLGFGWYGLPF